MNGILNEETPTHGKISESLKMGVRHLLLSASEAELVLTSLHRTYRWLGHALSRTLFSVRASSAPNSH